MTPTPGSHGQPTEHAGPAEHFEHAEHAEHAQLPTVREILSLPEVEAGSPELVTGSTGLERQVRWAHVVAGRAAAALLDGGELILTTGAGWPTAPAELAPLVTELTDAGVAGIVLELGATFAETPETLASACQEHGIPLIVLHREVRFVQITQRVHQQILAAQTEALEAREDVHAMLTELGLNRSPVDYVIERLAATLGAPVVLEGPGHHVIAWASAGAEAGSGPEDVLAAWADADGAEFALPEGWIRVPVEAHGTRWGQLTALPGDPHPAGRRTVLELGAFALALGRLADANGEQWLQFRSKRLFDVLLSGRYRRDTDLATQLASGGLPITDRVLVSVTLTGVGDFGAHTSLERAILETALRRAVAPEGRALVSLDPAASPEHPVLLALLSFPEGDPRVEAAGDGDLIAHAASAGAASVGAAGTGAAGAGAASRGAASVGVAPPLAVRLARELDMLLPTPTPPAWRAHLNLGVPGRRVRALVTAIEQVRGAGNLPPIAAAGRVTVQQAKRQPLAYLIRGLSTMPEVQEFAADTLGPVIEHDRLTGPGHTGDLLQVLEAYTAHPTNRSLAAKQARLSRSVFYQRLALIEELLGIDLSDGASIATLTVALLARSSTGSEGRVPGR